MKKAKAFRKKEKWLKEVPGLRRKRSTEGQKQKLVILKVSQPLVRATDEDHIGQKYTKLDAVGQLRLNDSLETGVQIARDDSRFRFYKVFVFGDIFLPKLKSLF